MFGGPEAKETAIFTGIFDRFFDSLNVCNFTDGKHQRKPFKDPYRSGTDFRLKVQGNSYNKITTLNFICSQ